MKIILNFQKHRAGVYSDETIFDAFTDLVRAIEWFYPSHTIPGRYQKKEVAKAKRIEYLAKALVVTLKERS